MPDIPSRTMLDESLSALMDGEAQEMELRRLLQQMPLDPALRARWARYQSVSAVMHKQPDGLGASLGFADAVQAAIQKEAPLMSSPEEGTWQMTRRFAVAASVALAVVVGVQWQQNISGDRATGGAGQLAVVPFTAAPVGVLASGATVMPVNQPLTGNVFEQAKDIQGGRYMQRNLEPVSLGVGKNQVPLAPAVVLPNPDKQR